MCSFRVVAALHILFLLLRYITLCARTPERSTATPKSICDREPCTLICCYNRPRSSVFPPDVETQLQGFQSQEHQWQGGQAKTWKNRLRPKVRKRVHGGEARLILKVCSATCPSILYLVYPMSLPQRHESDINLLVQLLVWKQTTICGYDVHHNSVCWMSVSTVRYIWFVVQTCKLVLLVQGLNLWQFPFTTRGCLSCSVLIFETLWARHMPFCRVHGVWDAASFNKRAPCLRQVFSSLIATTGVMPSFPHSWFGWYYTGASSVDC